MDCSHARSASSRPSEWVCTTPKLVMEIKLSTPEGSESFTVDTLAGSKLSVFEEGMPITLELDEANVVIDIHRGQ